jgi:hypothetical protein
MDHASTSALFDTFAPMGVREGVFPRGRAPSQLTALDTCVASPERSDADPDCNKLRQGADVPSGDSDIRNKSSERHHGSGLILREGNEDMLDMGRKLHKGAALDLRAEGRRDGSGRLLSDGVVRDGSRKRKRLRAAIGVRALWIAEEWRHKGVGCTLLDTARRECLVGLVPDREEVAWAEWLPDLLPFAARYCGGPQCVLLFS